MPIGLRRARISIITTLALTFSLLGLSPGHASETIFNCEDGGSYTVSSGVVTTNNSCAGHLLFDVSVTSIGNLAFNDNSSLSSVVIPASVTAIGARAFDNTKINSVTFNEGLISIGNSAFANINRSSSLLNVILPNSLTSLGGSAFAQSRLGHVVLGTGLTTIPDSSFYNNFGSGALSVKIPSVVTALERGAFIGLRQQYLYLPDSITSIGERAFESSSLRIVRLPQFLSFLQSGGFNASGGMQKVAYCGNLAGVKDTAGISGSPVVCGKVAEFKSNVPGEFDITYLQVASSSEALETPGFFRFGHEITSWNLQADGLGTAYPAGSSFPFTSDTILYASWSVLVYTVSFDPSEGSTQTALNFTFGGSPVSLPTSSRSGYEFLGWFDSSQPASLLSGNYTPGSNLTLTASWSEIAQVAAETPAINVPLPTITKFSNQDVLPGENVVVSGQRLDQVHSVSVGALNAEISLQSEAGFTFRTPDLLAVGSYDIVLETASGRMTLISALKVNSPVSLISFALRPESNSLSEEHLEEVALISAMFASNFRRIHCLVNGADELQAAVISAQICGMMLPEDSTPMRTKQTIKSSFKGNGFWVRVYIVGWADSRKIAEK